MVRRWYVVRVQSGKEERIKETLEKRIASKGLEAHIQQVVIPSERVTEIKGGKKSVRERKLYPGYLMVEMDIDEKPGEEAWYAVRETPGIGDFLGSSKPVAMEEHEVQRILDTKAESAEKPKMRIDFTRGDSVRIKEGPFENFEGQVEEIIPDKGLLRVIVTIFGRATPVELEYWQVEKV